MGLGLTVRSKYDGVVVTVAATKPFSSGPKVAATTLSATREAIVSRGAVSNGTLAHKASTALEWALNGAVSMNRSARLLT